MLVARLLDKEEKIQRGEISRNTVSAVAFGGVVPSVLT